MTTVNAVDKTGAQAVKLVQAALAKSDDEINVLVANPGTAMDVKRFLERQGLKVTIEDNDGTMTLSTSRSQNSQTQARQTQIPATAAPAHTGHVSHASHVGHEMKRTHSNSNHNNTSYNASSNACEPDLAILIRGATLGTEDPELGRILMLAFLSTLASLQAQQFRSSDTKLNTNPVSPVTNDSVTVTTIVLMNGGVKLATYNSPSCDHLKDLQAHGAKILVSATCAAHFGLTEDVGVGQIADMREIVMTLAREKRVLTL